MADFYPYLIPSLPMLYFGMKPPFSFEGFLELCRRFIPEKDYTLLQNLPMPGEYPQTSIKNATIRKWIAFDITLRNELVRVRAAKKHVEPSQYLRLDGYIELSLVQAAMAANTNPSILDAEKMLDEIRWKALDECASGHHFDLDSLIMYAYKLLILLRWENIRTADSKTQLAESLPHP